jgi:hypothetical protein
MMKKIFVAATAFLLTSALHAQTTTPATNTGSATQFQQDISKYIDFKETDHDFGKIPYGKPVEFEVEMKNISKDSIKITNVQVGCGCTTPKWQPGPYAAGETFKITLGFNGYTEGHFEKYVTIFFENGLSKQIKFHGETFKTPDNPAPANGAVQKLKNPGK